VLTMMTRKLPLILLLMAVIVSAGSLIQLQPVSATFPGANGKIVFERNISATTTVDYEIFTVNPDGSGLTQLTFTGENFGPRWSADGTKIVFFSDRVTPADNDGSYEIWIMNSDGSGQTQLTFNPNSFQAVRPAFSPDGSKIVFESNQLPSTNPNIWVMNADGSNQKQLTTSSGDYLPVWSPDGSKIVFNSARTGHSQIFVMNAADGSGQTDISKSPSNTDMMSEWSPDGRMIAFTRITQAGVESIWVMNAADGSGQKQLSNPTNGLSDFTPAWSPDGTKIAFARGIDSIWVMNADGSNPTDITQSQPNSDTDEFPNWQPLPARPVGGVLLPTSKLDIVAPFAALAGLIAVVSAVVAVKRRRD
jgi:Tol biopolymer transport system component